MPYIDEQECIVCGFIMFLKARAAGVHVYFFPCTHAPRMPVILVPFYFSTFLNIH